MLTLFLTIQCSAQVFIPFAFWSRKESWTPTQLGTSLLAWYDASVSSSVRTGAAGISQANSGNAVSEWRDLSGNAYHLAQSLAARQPVFEATAWTGSKPTIDWNGVDHGLVATGITWQAYTVGMVARHNGIGGVRAIITKRPAVSASFFWFIFNSTAGSFNWDQNGARYNTAFVPTIATDYVYTLLRPLAGSNRVQYVNGSVNGTTATNADNVNSENLTLGNDYSAANRGADALISEVVIANAGLPDNTRQQLEGYLAWKWGTVSSLPALHPYKTAPP